MMYSKLKIAAKYLQYCFTASNGKGHGIHSPFVFDFIVHVLNDKRHFYAYSQVEALRQQLLTESNIIHVEDFGAGSSMIKTNQRSISSIARFSAKSKKWGQLLFRIANYYQPKTIVELGTSLGLSSAYLASADPKSKLFTVEGSSEIALAAQGNFRSLQLHNIESLTGNFDDVLPGLLKKNDSFDLAFIDGNHRRDPTLKYFRMLSDRSRPSSIIIFDDIHWSTEMEEAWEIIKASE
ncbi:MAG: class I SAM-dependent methyltransferase, partial [Bacteroidetes bacterium]|nr:class I SAM-dependent methyltransferase [Bacteroidota bacterium]